MPDDFGIHLRGAVLPEGKGEATVGMRAWFTRHGRDHGAFVPMDVGSERDLGCRAPMPAPQSLRSRYEDQVENGSVE